MPRFEIRPATERSEADEAALVALTRSVYPPDDDPWSGAALEWASSDWDVMTWSGDRLVAYVGVLYRMAELDGAAVAVGGIGGVKTEPDSRGEGLASQGIAKALGFLRERGAMFGLLVCDEDLVAYYSRLGWARFEGTMLTLQHGKPEVFDFNRVMLIDLVGAAPTEGVIDLKGPPW